MKLLCLGDNNYGDRDRETDAFYQGISLALRTNAVRNGDDLTIIYANSPDSYFDSVVKQVVEYLEGPIQVTPLALDQVNPDRLNEDGSLDTTLHLEEDDPAEIYSTLDPTVDAIGIWSHDLLTSDYRELLEQILADGYIVTWVTGYGTGAIPNELYPDGVNIPGTDFDQTIS